jgi:hypothetical protein
MLVDQGTKAVWIPAFAGMTIVGSKDMVNNKLCIWLVRFGRTASLQIAYVAGPHRTICA